MYTVSIPCTYTLLTLFFSQKEASVETLVVTFTDGTTALARNQALAQDIWCMLSYHNMSRNKSEYSEGLEA